MELKHIDNCHRVGKMPADGRPRAIIVKFSTYRDRKRLYDARTQLADHNKRLRRVQGNGRGDTDEVFHEAGTEPAEVPVSQEPQDQPAGRRPGSRATTRNLPVHEPSPDADPNALPQDDDSNQPDEFISKWPVYINEALCKSRSKLSFAARVMKKNGQINDTWTTDGRVKIRTLYNRIKNIETMAELEEYARN